MLKALKGEETAAKFQVGVKKVKQRGPKEKVPDNEVRKGSPVKKLAGASKGGQLNKKEREVMGMARDRVDLTEGATAAKEEEKSKWNFSYYI